MPKALARRSMPGADCQNIAAGGHQGRHASSTPGGSTLGGRPSERARSLPPSASPAWTQRQHATARHLRARAAGERALSALSAGEPQRVSQAAYV
eukprot:6196205-Pyramimonas_sp.AAC.1